MEVTSVRGISRTPEVELREGPKIRGKTGTPGGVPRVEERHDSQPNTNPLRLKKSFYSHSFECQ